MKTFPSELRGRRWRIALRSVLVLVAAAVVALISGLQSDRDPRELELRWARPPSQFVDVSGQRVHLRDEGSGPPLLLLHGTSSSLHTWDGWTAALTSDVRVVRMDLPGFGLTGPRTDADYSIAAWVDFIDRLADKLGIACFALAGNSLGGLIAWRYALAHPERVGALVLVDAAGLPRPDTPLLIRLGKTPVVGDLLPYVTPRWMVNRQVRHVYGDPSRISSEVRDRYWELLLRKGNRRAFQQYTRMVNFSEFSERLGEITAPTLVLWGSEDRLIPVTHATEFVRRMPHAQAVILEGVGHVPMEEAPEASVQPVQQFLRERNLCPR